MDHFSGMHNWYACSHARPTYCNVCREALSGVTSHGLSCEGTEAAVSCWGRRPGLRNPDVVTASQEYSDFRGPLSIFVPAEESLINYFS